MSALPVSLEDKYQLASGRIYLNGTGRGLIYTN